MEGIALIVMVAMVLEALVEYTKTIINLIRSKDYYTAIMQGVTIILGIVLAFIFNCQLFNNAVGEFYKGLAIDPTIDIVLTGILFSRGSNFVSDLFSKLRNPSIMEYPGTEMFPEYEHEPVEEDEDETDNIE